MESIPLNKIICVGNRTYTKDEGFEQLVNSIKQYGIIQMPTVRRIDDQYKVIAGRRRIRAAEILKYTHVNCEVRDEDAPVDIDEEIALTENVNRQEMHPLDEAGAFRRMVDNGNPIEEIARYYARSQSAIYKRLRLCGLVEELKSLCRDGKLNISGAAVLAELPEEDQYEFYEKYKEVQPEMLEIRTFINKKQRHVIRKCMKNCEGCNKRTHNEGNELFEEFNDFDDVCLDPDCYRVKWYEMIASRLEEQKIQLQEAGLQTDDKVLLRCGIPVMLYKKASFVNITDSSKQNIKYEILHEKDFEFTPVETTRKKDTCWAISEHSEMGIDIRRVGYKARPPREKQSSLSKMSEESLVNAYENETLKIIADERDMKPIEIVNTLNKNISHYDFKGEIADIVFNRVVAMRMKLESSEEPPRQYLQMYLRILGDSPYRRNDLLEENFNIKRKKWFEDLFGKGKNYSKISAGFSDEVLKLFHFLLLCEGFQDEVPNLDRLKNIEKENNHFWEYAAMTKDDYRAMYLKAAKEVTAKYLPKDNSQKKKPDAPHGEYNLKTAAGSTSSSLKQKKSKRKIDEDFDDNDPLGPPDEDEGYPDIDMDDEE